MTNLPKVNMNVEQQKLKAKNLLEKLLTGENTQIEKYLNKFLLHLDWENQTGCEVVFPIVFDWVLRAVPEWSAAETKPPTSSICFALNLASLLSHDENKFKKLNCDNFFIKLVNLSKHSDCVSLKFAYIKLLSSLLDHNSGIESMIGCLFWEDVVNWSLTTSPTGLIKESTLFIKRLLQKTVDFNDDFCEGVIKKIMQPLGETIYRCIKFSEDVSDETAVKTLLPSLKLLCQLLESFLKDVLLEGKDFSVLFFFLKHFQLEGGIYDFMTLAQKRCLVYELTKIMFMMQFLELYGQVITNTTTVEKVSKYVERIKMNFWGKLYRGDFQEQLDFCIFSVFYWKLMRLRIPFQRNKFQDFDISDQFIYFIFLPHFQIKAKYTFTRTEINAIHNGDHYRNRLVKRVFKLYTSDFRRIMTFWHEKLVDKSELLKAGRNSFNAFKEVRVFVTRDQSILMFQMFTYTLGDLVDAAKKTPEKLDIFVTDSWYLLRWLEEIAVLIEQFEITLKDSLEATYLMEICLDLLSLKEWSSELIVKILSLINIAVGRYLVSTLTFLVADTKETTLSLLGSVLQSNLIDERSEVGKAALDVVYTVARISNDKFPSLQKVLMDSELPTLVVKMSTCDGESFVRATAIKCLQEMIQVEEIWNNALKSEDLTQKMRDILINETEGIVRVEAATFMCVAYEHQQFPKDTLDGIYETMIYSSTTDLHWEVKVRALGFWDKVIKNHLQNQGMIDGSFPNVTFSKEHRKIVTLTDSEIRKRLLKVLSQLSSIGCLGVLMSAIKDDCDMEVSKTAMKITQRLIDLFKKYNVRTDCSTPTSPAPTENGLSARVSMSSGISVDDAMDSPASSHPDFNEEIIDQIVNSKDVNLLKSVYTPSDYGSVSNYDIQVRKIVTPTEFLQFTQQDLNAIISEKKKWLNGIEDLGSLLDDMLKTYDDDVNNMDCY